MMRATRVWLLALLVLTMGLAACDNNDSTGPSGTFTGTWSGTIVDSVAGIGTARLILTQTGSGITGTYTTTFTNTALNRAGTASGTASGATASVFLTPSAVVVCSASLTLSGTMGASLTLSGTKVTGTYSVLGCTTATTGTLDLSRQ
jgi:hypothetical protein